MYSAASNPIEFETRIGGSDLVGTAMNSTRIVTAVDERRDTILSVIREAKREISLSLFRCNDDAIFDALADATQRGVAVDALITSRAKGGPK